MKLLVPLSGGKDSQATLLWCIEKYGVENLTAVFCDTQWEHEITYNHIDYLVKETGVKFLVLKSEKYDGFVDLCKKKKRFPSFTTGFCTEELKIFPMINYLLDVVKDNVLIFQGIRRDESKKRRNAPVDCRYFKYYFEPYKSNEITIAEYNEEPPITARDKAKLKKAIERLAAGFNDEKYFTYRKEEVFAFCEQFADDIHRPFVTATGDEVIYYSLNRGYHINPLYYRGASRVGCFPCKNARISEITMIVKGFPEVIDKIRSAENYVEGTFFSPNYIPKRYLTGFDPKSGKKICTIDDVVRYVTDKTAQTDMLEDLGYETKCKSVYNICE